MKTTKLLGTSCVDHINTFRIITEQWVEWQSPLFVLFIDFKPLTVLIERQCGFYRAMVYLLDSWTLSKDSTEKWKASWEAGRMVHHSIWSSYLFCCFSFWTENQSNGIQWCITTHSERTWTWIPKRRKYFAYTRQETVYDPSMAIK